MLLTLLKKHDDLSTITFSSAPFAQLVALLGHPLPVDQRIVHDRSLTSYISMTLVIIMIQQVNSISSQIPKPEGDKMCPECEFTIALTLSYSKWRKMCGKGRETKHTRH